MPEVQTDCTLRAARTEDANAVVRLLRGIYVEGRSFVGDGPPRPEALARHFTTDDPDFAGYLVAESDKAIVGWLEVHRSRPARLRHVAMLTLAVAAGHRRRGIGRALLRGSYAWASRRGVEKLALHVRAGNEGAIHLYQSEGFALEGREVRGVRTGDGYEDNLIMARFL